MSKKKPEDDPAVVAAKKAAADALDEARRRVAPAEQLRRARRDAVRKSKLNLDARAILDAADGLEDVLVKFEAEYRDDEADSILRAAQLAVPSEVERKADHSLADLMRTGENLLADVRGLLWAVRLFRQSFGNEIIPDPPTLEECKAAMKDLKGE